MHYIKKTKIGMILAIALLSTALYAGQVLYNQYASKQATADMFYHQRLIACDIYEADSNNTYMRYQSSNALSVFIRHIYSTTAYGGTLTINEKAYEIWDISLLSGYTYEPVND